MRWIALRPIRAALLGLAMLAWPGLGIALGTGQSHPAAAPSAAPPSATAGNAAGEGVPANPVAGHGRLLLVLPFENHSAPANLDWISGAVPEILNRRLASAGFMPIGRDDRLYALDHLGLPESFQPSRASAVRLAQNLDANYVIVGSFAETGSRFSAIAQILDMDTLHLSEPIQEEAEMTHLLEVLSSLSWRIAKRIDPQFAAAQSSFVAADPDLNLAAFENYVRGLIENSSAARINRLKEAVRLDPTFNPALFALGKAYFDNQQYELAATTLGRLPKDASSAREADFYRGLAYLYIGSYVKAEDAFAFVSRELPLPEVVNNQGVAASRRGKDGSALFQQAVAADPADPDYQFNLSLALSRKNDIPGAEQAIEQTLKLRPRDEEAQAFAATLHARAQHPASANTAAPAAGDDAEPLERVKRTFNEASFRQAAFEMEQMEAMRLATLPPAKHAAALAEAGTRFLYEGLILEAEREFQAALQTDSGNASAHAGMAMVREREGDADAARTEAAASLKLQPNVAAYLVLTRLDMARNNNSAATDDLSHALQMEPENSAARSLRQQLEAHGQQVP
jgi:Flp pilus assembly protein TadD/TolB-like protein